MRAFRGAASPVGILLLCAAAAGALAACDGDGDGDGDGTPAADAGPAGGTPTALALPQAVGGALWANPDLYPAIPLRIVVTGGAEEVVVRLDERATVAAPLAGEGVPADTWLALVPLDTTPEGPRPLKVIARGGGAEVSLDATLGVGRAGVRLTNFYVDGAATTPRLHRQGERLFVTWADRREGLRKLWLGELDGAGRWLGDPVALVADDTVETLHGRAAVGGASIGVVYQRPGGPYENWFTIVDETGAELLAPIALEPPGMYGSMGGEVAWDGEAYVIIWRSNDGMGSSELRWLRVRESDHAVTGPVVLARGGAGTAEDPIGKFSPFTFITLSVVAGPKGGSRTLVGFVRERYDATLDFAVPKAQYVVVDEAGDELDDGFVGIEHDYTWHDEHRVFAHAGGFFSVWSSKDLTSLEDNPPTRFFGARADASGAYLPGDAVGRLMVAAPEHRVEPHLVAHPEKLGVMAWCDERSYVDLLGGRIELYVAPLRDDLGLDGEPLVIPHARFIENTGDVRGVAAGSNVLLFWLDEREGGAIGNSKPELRLETVWF